LEVAPDDGVRLGELGHALLGDVLALAPHVIDEPLTMQCRPDHACGSLEGGKLGRVDGALLAGVLESGHADKLSTHEYPEQRLGLRPDTAHRGAAPARGAFAIGETDAAAGAQLGTYRNAVAFIARAGCSVLE